jgi:hypothetical protein
MGQDSFFERHGGAPQWKVGVNMIEFLPIREEGLSNIFNYYTLWGLSSYGKKYMITLLKKRVIQEIRGLNEEPAPHCRSR